MHAVQLCSRATVAGKEKTYTIQSAHPELQKKAKPSLIQSIDLAFADKPKDKAKWLGRLAAVEALFA